MNCLMYTTGWGVLLVDAVNAFNSLSHAAMLLQVRVLWLCCARFIFNTYHGWSVSVLRGSSDYLYSKEGVTQGDPLSMFIYGVTTYLFPAGPFPMDSDLVHR